MDLFIQRIFDGLFNGGIYASLAVAIVITYRTTGILNFAQGEMATFSAYFAVMLLHPGSPFVAGSQFVEDWVPGAPWPVPLAIAAAVVVGMAIGALAERVFIRPLADAPELSIVNVTIGLLIVVNALMIEIWGLFPQQLDSPFPTGPDDYFGVMGARLRYETLGVWATLLAVMLILLAMLKFTRQGLAYRAATTNAESARLCGIRLARTRLTGWAIAGGLGALAATLVAHSVILEPLMMIRLLIFSFAAATLGGLDNPSGAVAGGLIIGLAQSLIPGYVPGIDSQVSVVPVLVVMLIVLLVRPAGLFGTRRIVRV